MAIGLVAYDEPNAPLSDDARQKVAALPRLELAEGILNRPTDNVFTKLAENYKVRYFGFGEKLIPAKGKGEKGPVGVGADARAQANSRATRLGAALEQALGRFSGQAISGVVVMTDGASNGGLEPLEVTRRMKEQSVPLYAVGIGLVAPPDVRIDTVLVPETVFAEDKVPVRVQVSSVGFAGKRAKVTMKFEGREVASEPLKLADGTQFVEMLLEPERKADAARLEVSVAMTTRGMREASLENNKRARTIRVIDEKIKVLYIEGKPRWEYRYLRRVLLRDHRLAVNFIMTEGDKELARYSDRYLAGFPVKSNEAFKYDLVILGDVRRDYFTSVQLKRMTELVREQGGSVLVLAGLAHTPVEYVGTPIAEMLPVRARADGWDPVGDMVHPKATAEGDLSAVTALEIPSQRNEALWRQVRPMFKVPRLDGLKQGAILLLELSDTARRGKSYPLLAWQRFGSGKVMYVGTDQLWRLRYKRGDKYHARFWGQTIQFLTLSRLLGGNKRIRLETDRNAYHVGERVRITANVLDEAYSPVADRSFTVALDREGPGGKGTTVGLAPVPGMLGLFQGYYALEEPGRYKLSALDAPGGAANSPQFNVESVSLEGQEPAMQEDLLRQMAESSGGRYFRISELPKLTEVFPGRKRPTTLKFSRDLFDLPAIFVVLVALLGVEWLLRRKFDLI